MHRASLENQDLFAASPIKAEDMPVAARQGLIYRAGVLVDPGSKPSSINVYNDLRMTTLPSGFLAFYGLVRKTFRDGTEEDTIQIVNTTPSGLLAGASEVRNEQQPSSDELEHKPFVGATNTAMEYRQQGLGRDRLVLMGQLAFTLFRGRLNSDIFFAHGSAQKMWEELASHDYARKYNQQSRFGRIMSERYVLTKDLPAWPVSPKNHSA